MRESLCGDPANSSGWFDLGLIHTARFTASGQTYYTFGDSETDNWSQEFVYYPPPPAGTVSHRGRPSRVALLADMGIGSHESIDGVGQTEPGGVGGDVFTWTQTGYPSYNTTLSVTRFIDNGQLDALFLNGNPNFAFYLSRLNPKLTPNLSQLNPKFTPNPRRHLLCQRLSSLVGLLSKHDYAILGSHRFHEHTRSSRHT